MSEISASTEPLAKTRIIHPVWVRVSHWLNAVAVIIMVMSGWQIYNATGFFGFAIPKAITLGGWLGGAIQWHFAAMWLLVVNAMFYFGMGIYTKRFAHKLFPLSIKAIWQDFWLTLRGKLSHTDLSHYNALQKLAYLFVIVDITILIMSGLVLWKSVQFPILRDLMGGYEVARRIHFIAMAGIVGFFIVHITLVALVPKTLLAMIRGR